MAEKSEGAANWIQVAIKPLRSNCSDSFVSTVFHGLLRTPPRGRIILNKAISKGILSPFLGDDLCFSELSCFRWHYFSRGCPSPVVIGIEFKTKILGNELEVIFNDPENELIGKFNNEVLWNIIVSQRNKRICDIDKKANNLENNLLNNLIPRRRDIMWIFLT